jgi:hypothetical protein
MVKTIMSEVLQRRRKRGSRSVLTMRHQAQRGAGGFGTDQSGQFGEALRQGRLSNFDLRVAPVAAFGQ